jgi:drug/metabolite transporter (DMT)-like permease
MPASPLIVLAFSLVGISFAGPLTRLSHADPLAIAVWRLAISMAIIGAIVGVSGSWRQWRRLAARDLAIALGAGAMLALHFWAWNASIGMTTVSASVVLVNVQPVIVAGASALWLHESPTRGQWVGIGIAVAGAMVVGLADAVGTPAATVGAPPHALLGDLLALSGGVTAALYYLAGRRLRRTLDLWPYVALVYGACLIVLLAFAAAARTPLAPQPPREMAIFAALALGPMLLGHTGMNWALRYLPAYVVNLTTLGEPVGATILAAALPGIREIPRPLTLAGGALVLAGILITLTRSPRMNATQSVSDAA